MWLTKVGKAMAVKKIKSALKDSGLGAKKISDLRGYDENNEDCKKAFTEGYCLALKLFLVKSGMTPEDAEVAIQKEKG